MSRGRASACPWPPPDQCSKSASERASERECEGVRGAPDCLRRPLSYCLGECPTALCAHARLALDSRLPWPFQPPPRPSRGPSLGPCRPHYLHVSCVRFYFCTGALALHERLRPRMDGTSGAGVRAHQRRK
jgi:hypothetical protein